MIGVEIVRDQKTKERAGNLRDEPAASLPRCLFHRCFKSAVSATQTLSRPHPHTPKQEIKPEEYAQDHETILRPARNNQYSHQRRKPARKQNRAAQGSTEMRPEEIRTAPVAIIPAPSTKVKKAAATKG